MYKMAGWCFYETHKIITLTILVMDDGCALIFCPVEFVASQSHLFILVIGEFIAINNNYENANP